jgi:hypothetical protein
MKNRMRHILAALLAVVLAVGTAGCGSKEPPAPDPAVSEPVLLNEKLVEMLELYAARDPDGGYTLIYPGVTDLATQRAAAEAAYEYFPVTAGYTWDVIEWSAYKGPVEGSEITEGHYWVESDGKGFHVYATWRADSDRSGFTEFQVVSQEDWAAGQTG